MIVKRVFFAWATHYVGVAHKGQAWTEASFGPGFTLGPGEEVELRHAMAERGVTVSDSLWRADHDFILRQLRADLATAAGLGPTARYRILVEDDAQLNAVLGLFPQASRLMSHVQSEPRKGAKKIRPAGE
jgi:hypothetical protein